MNVGKGLNVLWAFLSPPYSIIWFWCFPDVGYLAIYQKASNQTQDNPFNNPTSYFCLEQLLQAITDAK